MKKKQTTKSLTLLLSQFVGMTNGYKTYICVSGAIVTVGLQVFELVDLDTANTLYAIFGFGAVAALRASKK